MTYGKRLQKALKATGKSRKQLAGALDCTVQAIGMVITGGGKAERGLSAENNARAARFLRIDSHWLATGEGEMKSKTADLPKDRASLSEDALELGVYFDHLTDPGDRTRAYVAAMAVILKIEAERAELNAVQATATPDPSANPKKQPV